MMVKWPPYAGVLDEPFEFETPAGLSVDEVPLMYLALGLPTKAWPDILKSSWLRDVEKFDNRVLALFRHYGIDSEAPQAFLDLALCLAYRHERDTLIDGPRVQFSAVCALYKTTDINVLVQRLAAKHVPGFQLARPKRSAGRLTTMEWIHVFLTVVAVAERLEQRGAKATIHQIAAVMLDQKQLPKIISPKAARSVRAILLRTGNKERGSARKLESRNTFLRTKIREARRAWADIKLGKANNFQIQMLSEVLPALHRLAR